MSGIFYNTFLLYLVHWIIIFLLRLIVTYFDLNSDLHPASHSLPIDTSEMYMRLGLIYPSDDSSSKAGEYGKHVLLDFMVWPFRHPTHMGDPIFIDRLWGAST